MTQKLTEHMSEEELKAKRDEINDTLMDDMETKQGSADPSADDEKKKYIAQHGHPIHQETSQDVPEPVSDKVKDLQNDKAEEEHQERGEQNLVEQLETKPESNLTPDQKDFLDEHGHGTRVTDEQHDKLKDKRGEEVADYSKVNS